MVCEMETDQVEELMEMEPLTSMWPDDIETEGKPYNVEKPGGDQDMLEEVIFRPDPTVVDSKHLLELTRHTDKGSSQMTYLVKNWEMKQANAVRLLKEELDILSRQREESELKKLEIFEEHQFEEERYGGEKRPISILDELYDIWHDKPKRKNHVFVPSKRSVEIDEEYGSTLYWKQRALHLEKMLETSIHREQALKEKLQESITSLEGQSSPVEELSQILKRADNFLHFVLQNAPVVIGHQDKELRYRFIYNHFPSLHEEDIIGKTDTEIFTGSGVKESQEFKREVLEKGKPAKREITFETELFGSKTFLIYVEPVFSKSGETIGVNYMGMEITDQVIKREKMAKLREEIAVQKAKETELNKTIHITEETMRAKQMLATMSHEIRSPLSGVVSMADILSATKLDREQRQLLNVMISSGDLVLQLINDILDLSKVESGVMKLEATKFRPREVVKHVLQTAAASLRKSLTLEGHVADDVPIEVVGDVLRIRQILTNLISNAVKFTHEGKVGIKLYVIEEPLFVKEDANKEERCISTLQRKNSNKGFLDHRNGEMAQSNEPTSPSMHRHSTYGDTQEQSIPETTVWIRCDVYDTGIGIPENALPNLFKKYMQVSADHARKYGGTGLGLAICKQLVELMGGRLTVTSQVKQGSTFTFVLPYKVSPTFDNSDDPDDMLEMADQDATIEDLTEGFFEFQPRTLGSLFACNGSARSQKLLPEDALNEFSESSEAAEAAETLLKPETSYNQQGKNSSELDSVKDSEATSRQADTMPKKSEDEKLCHKKERLDISLQSKHKILLVEDNKINIMVTQSMMKQLGHTMDIVNNGIEAVRAVQSSTYDLILMDVSMPVMDGLTATRIIRSFEETGNWEAAKNAGINQTCSDFKPCTKRRPIIAMTANSLSESAEECYKNGMDSFVSKPVSLQKLKECIGKYLT